MPNNSENRRAVVRRVPVLAALLAGGAAAIGAAVPAIIAAGFARPGFFSEYVAFFALTSPALVIAASRRVPIRSAIALGLAAGLPALILSNNNSVWIASALGLLAAAIFALSARWPQALANLDRHRLAGLLVPATLVAVTLGVALVGYEGLVRSLTSRLYLDRIALEALYDRPWSLFVGQGWGRTSEIILAHFNASGAVLWDGSWDATLRRYTHTHNLLFETVLAAGLPALFGIVAMVTLVPVLARRGLLPVAAGFSIAFAALSAVWFQVAMTIPAAALAVGWLVRPARPPRALRRLTSVPAAWLAVLLVCGVASFVVAIWLTKAGLAIRHGYFAENETMHPALPCEALPLDLDRGSFTLAQSFSKAYEAAFADERAGRPVSAAHMARLDRLLCAVGRAAAVSHSADLLIMPVLFRSTIAFDPPLVQMRDRFSDTFPTWERALDRFLVYAPRRTDIAWPYLSWLMERGQYNAVLAFCRRLLARDPIDPIGLWFMGSVYTRADQPAVRQQGFDMLRQSLRGGIDRSMPIPPELRAAIWSAYAQP